MTNASEREYWREAKRNYRKKNYEKQKEYRRLYRERNKERLKEYHRLYWFNIRKGKKEKKDT